jgi:hypothetical protein
MDTLRMIIPCENALRRGMRFFFIAFILFPFSVQAQSSTFRGHLKYQPTVEFSPSGSVQRALGADTSHSHEIDLRVNGELQYGKITGILHGESLALGGTRLQREGGVTGVQQNLPWGALTDDRKLFDLATEGASHAQFETLHRLDRAALGYSTQNFVARVGRQVYSVGNGLVFQALDLFNPFSPVEIDRDYKAGEDMLYLDSFWGEYGEGEIIVVPRRDLNGDLSHEESSYGGVYTVTPQSSSLGGGGSTIQLFGAQHYDEWNFGIGSSSTVSESVFRFDALFTRVAPEAGDAPGEDPHWVTSIVANLDTSWIVGGVNLYTYIEYYRNGFGEGGRVRNFDISETLLDRLQRGELYVRGRDYLALGGRVELSPLVNLWLSEISHLGDGSGFFQLRLQYDFSQNWNVVCGVNAPYGRKGSEFGGGEVAPGAWVRPSRTLYSRFSFFF